MCFFFFSSRRRHTRLQGDWSSDVCSSDLTTAPPGKEVRVTGIGELLVTERRAGWERWYGPVAAARWGSAFWHALAWAIFGFAYAGAVVFVSSGLRAPASQV